MGVIATLREGTIPATQSRRTPDPGKLCIAPSCTIRFYRKPKELLKDYNARDTCCKTCWREVHTPVLSKSEESYKQLDPTQLSCGNCQYMREDSEIGDHCGPCTTGQGFVKREGLR